MQRPYKTETANASISARNRQYRQLKGLSALFISQSASVTLTDCLFSFPTTSREFNKLKRKKHLLLLEEDTTSIDTVKENNRRRKSGTSPRNLGSNSDGSGIRRGEE